MRSWFVDRDPHSSHFAQLTTLKLATGVETLKELSNLERFSQTSVLVSMPALVRNKSTTATKAAPTRVASRSKKGPSNSSPQDPADTANLAEDDLAQRLATVRLDEPLAGPSTSKGKNAASTVTRTASSRNVPAPKPTTQSKSSASKKGNLSTPSTNETGDASNEAGPSRTSSDPQVDDAERLNMAMKAFNSASSGLSSALQAGWKASKASASSTKPPAKAIGKKPVTPNDPPSGLDGYTIETMRRTAVACQAALQDVRRVGKGRRPPTDFEKAGGPLVAKLITLELYDIALEALEDMKPGLMSSYSYSSVDETDPGLTRAEPVLPQSRPKSKATTTSRPTAPRQVPSLLSTHQALHGLPLPSESTLDAIQAGLLSNFHVQSLTAISRIATKDSELAFEKAITQQGNFFEWYPVYVASGLDPANLSASLNQAARLVTSVDSLSPQILFNIRQWAMKCLIVCNMLDAATFWNQATKCAKVFAKAVEAKDDPASDEASAKRISAFFETLVAVAKEMPALQDPNALTAETMLQGPGFASACEYWTRFARFLNNVNLMTRISNLLEGGVNEARDNQEADAENDTVQAVTSTAQCCLILQRAATVLSSNATDGAEHVVAASNVLPRCQALLIKGKEDEASAKTLFRAMDEAGSG
ncbi:hypothetical protein FRB90_005136, partial [Tulasnella sp. 427]